MPELHLAGCRSRPLIGYLKALGILRVVSREGNGSARARWRQGTFELRCELEETQLMRLLLEDYSPSPVISPWNGGSGFHPNDRKEAILALEQTTEPRLAAYRETIHVARSSLSRLHIEDKPAPTMKLRLIRELRRRLPDAALPWLDAAIVVTGQRVAYPPLLGSGGNDGRYDFSNNYAQAVVRCVAPHTREESAASLSAALQGGAAELQRKLSLGHLQRDSSPTNSPHGEADNLGNPWDLILAIEGMMLLVGGAARRHGAAGKSALVAPFTVYSTAAGYGSAVNGESGRAELWLPLWPKWATCSEIEMLARESRAQVGRGHSRRQARTGLDFARAAGELGVARGVEAFERYAILERAGQANLAVPAGRVSVCERPAAKAIQSIDRWLDEMLRFGKAENCPRELQIAIRRLERASFRFATRSLPADGCAMLESIGAVEHALARSRAAIAAGVHTLRRAQASPWIEAADDGTAEFAAAVAMASLRDRRRRSPALRDYLHGTQDGGATFDPERRHAVKANGALRLLAATHARRHLDAARTRAAEPSDPPTPNTEHGQERGDGAMKNRLEFDSARWCDPSVARMLVAGLLDERRIVRLLHGLALLDHGTPKLVLKASSTADATAPTYEVLALAWMAHTRQHRSRESPERLGARPGWAARLAAGVIEPVIADAMRRLRMAGLTPIFTTQDLSAGAPSSTQLGPRLGAALLLRISPADIEQIAERLTIHEHSDMSQQRKEIA